MTHTRGRLGHFAACALVIGIVHACSGGGGNEPPVAPPPPPTPAVLSVELSTPSTDDGAILFTVSGPAVDSVTLGPYAGSVFLTGSGARVLAYGNVRAGVIARVFIRDARRVGEHAVRLDEAASRVTFQQRAVSAYGLALKQE